jgi:PAS domain S-box-containing protein
MCVSSTSGMSSDPQPGAAATEPAAAAVAATEPSAEHRFRLLVDSVRDYAIFILDPGGRVATWNKGAERIKGYRADEIIGRHFSAFYDPAEIAAGKCELELEVASRDGRFEDEGWRVRRDGTRFWANVVITALRDESGTLVGFGKVTRDLTERKAAEEQRRVAEARLGLLIESVKDYAIFVLDVDGRVATWNPGAERIKGYRADEIIGSHFSRFYPADEVRDGKCEHELTVAQREGRFEDEGWRIRKDGSHFWANVVISAIRDDLGNLVGYSKVTRDLTERVRAERDRAGRLAAERASEAKDEFMAMLGHELRNPLAPIVSALQLLKLRGDVRSMRELQIIERQVGQMTRLVDDLLDVSRIASGKIVPRKASIDLRDPLAKAVEMAIPSMEQKRQHFRVDVPPAPLPVHADDARLVQVFANLLNNACRYTPVGGHIAVTVGRSGASITVEVKDDGIGIDPVLLPRVFDLFVQEPQNVDRAEGGLGLGLALVRSLVDLHGGRVEARSEGKGRGSTFIVHLPIAIAAGVTATSPPTPPLVGAPGAAAHRILIVDDNDDARILLADMLRLLGHDVRAAADGKSALEQLDSFAPHVALLDIGLPDMDGYELAARMRARPDGTSIHLLAVTGYGQPIDQERTRRAGFAAHLVKPVDTRRLLEQIAHSASVIR